MCAKIKIGTNLAQNITTVLKNPATVALDVRPPPRPLEAQRNLGLVESKSRAWLCSLLAWLATIPLEVFVASTVCISDLFYFDSD